MINKYNNFYFYIFVCQAASQIRKHKGKKRLLIAFTVMLGLENISSSCIAFQWRSYRPNCFLEWNATRQSIFCSHHKHVKSIFLCNLMVQSQKKKLFTVWKAAFVLALNFGSIITKRFNNFRKFLLLMIFWGDWSAWNEWVFWAVLISGSDIFFTKGVFKNTSLVIILKTI